MDNIKVGIRVRPLLPKDHLCEQWITTEQTVSPSTPQNSTPYAFDLVFGTKATTNQIYDELAQPIVQAVMEGINGTIFAYGQTASGKTFTMLGEEPHHPGIILQAANHIFHYIQEHPEREHLIRGSYLEIYNETLTDLLSPGEKKLRIREDRERNFMVQNISEEPITSAEDIHSLIELGESYRTFGKTNANEHSSRSHTIFKLTIESRLKDEELSDGTIRVASLSLVDLAGSERVSATGSTGKQLKEGASINLSLHVLGKVISKLAEGHIDDHIPYRESKLTCVLKPSIGGNSKTAIICTISPCEIGESHSTLQFASRAKYIKNKPIVNEVVCGEEGLQKKIRALEKENEQLQHQLEQGLPEQKREALTQQLSQSETQKALLEQRLKALEAWIVRTNVSPGSELMPTTKAQRRRTLCPSLLSRDPAIMKQHVEDPLPSFAIHSEPLMSTTVKTAPQGKVVSFASSPELVEQSFQVEYSSSEFKNHLDQQEAVTHRAVDRLKGRPSFLPSPDFFEDSLDNDDTRSSDVHNDNTDKSEELSQLQKQCEELMRVKESLELELKESKESIRQLEKDLMEELEEKLFERSQEVADPSVVADLENELEVVKSTHQQQMETLRRELTATETRAEVCAGEKASLEHQLNEALKRCEQLASSAVPEVDILECYELEKEEHLKQLAEKDSELSKVTEKWTVAQAKHEKLKEQYDTDLQYLQESVTSLRAGLATAKASIEESEGEKADLRQQLVDSGERLERSEQTVTAHLETIRCFQEERANLLTQLNMLKYQLEQTTSVATDSLHNPVLDLTFQGELEAALVGTNQQQTDELVVSPVKLWPVSTNSMDESQSCPVLSLQDELEAALVGTNQQQTNELVVSPVELRPVSTNSMDESQSCPVLSLQDELEAALASNAQMQFEEPESRASELQVQEMSSPDKETELQDEVTRLRSALEEVSRRHKDEAELLQTNVEVLEEQLAFVRAECQSLREEKSSLCSELAEITSTHTAHMESLAKELKCKEELMAKEKARVSSLQKQMELSQIEKDALTNSLDQLKREICKAANNHRAQLQALTERKSSLEAQLKESSGNQEILEKEVLSLKSQLSGVTTSVSTLTEQNSSLEAQLKELREDLIETEKDRDRAEEERITAEEFEYQLEKDKHLLQKELKQKIKRIEELEGQVNQKGTMSSDDEMMKVKDLEKALVSLQSKLLSATTSVSALTQQKNSLEAQLSHATTHVSTLTEQNSSLEAQLKELREDLIETEKDRDRAEEERITAEEFEYQLEKDKHLLQKELKEKDKKLEEFTSQLNQKEASVAQKVQALEKEVVSLKSQLCNAATSVSTLSEQKSSLEAQLKELHEDLIEVEKDRDRAEEERITAEEFEYQLEKDKRMLQKELKEKDKKLEEFTSQLNKKEIESSVTQKVQTLEKEVVSLKSQLCNAATSVSTLTEQNSSLEAQLKELRKDLVEAEKDRDRANEERITAEEFEYQLEKDKHLLQKELKEMKQKMEDLETQLKEKISLLRSAEEQRAKSSELKSRPIRNQKENLDPEQDVASLKFQIKEICRLRSKDQREHRYAMMDLQDTLDAVRRDNKKLTEKIQIRAHQPPVHKYPGSAGSGVVTDFMYFQMKEELQKLKEATDKEKKDMERCCYERDSFYVKYKAIKKLCTCSALERAQNDPDFTL